MRFLTKLETGCEIPQKSSYKSSYTTYTINNRWEKDISEYSNTLPTIQLADIETAQNFEIYNDGYMSNQISY